jgi:serine/threonine-protein kinase
MAAQDKEPTGDALIGRTIGGKFTIESRVGGGGMGSVYRARQAGLNKVVAVKVLHKELLAEPTFASRFKREATAASRIDHPSSLRVIDFGEDPDGTLYIAMEYLEGRTLFKILREEAPLAPARIVDLSRQVLAALAAAHDLGIVHRDLKPENVIVQPGKDDDGGVTELVKVCDFGIAKLQAQREVDEKLTLEGSIIGTPEYLSPEQARGGQLDARSDLYSMGVILFEMLTGQPPFRGDSALATVLQHLDAPPPRPSTLVPSADPKLEAVCLKALSKAPADRFVSAREMRASLAIDTADLAPPPVPSRMPAILLMTETPPPVASPQTPVAQMSRRPSQPGPERRPRLVEMTGPTPSGQGRMVAIVVVLALAVGGAGASLLRRRAAPVDRGVAQAGPDPTSVVPQAVATTTAEPAAAPAPAASGAPAPSEVAALPPSELPATVAGVPHSRHRGAAAPSSSSEVGAVAPAPSGTPPPAPSVREDVAPAAAAPTGAVKVHLSNVQVTSIAATNVTAALPVGRFASCYHGAPGSHASVTVHLDLNKTEVVARCSVSDRELADLGACIVDATKRIVVPGVPPGGASADVDVEFDAR